MKPRRDDALRVFYSYSHQDEALLEQLRKQLAPMRRRGLVRDWHDRRIEPGTDWSAQLDRHLEQADLILLLVSPDFIASDYCHEIEMRRALQRHDAGEAWVVPIILRPVDWQQSEFARLQGLPIDLVPVTEWSNPDRAFHQVARALRAVVETMRGTPPGQALENSELPTPPAPGPRRVGLLLLTAALLLAAAGGWTLVQQRQGMQALLDQGRGWLDRRELDRAGEFYRQALARCWWGCGEAVLGLQKAGVYALVDGEYRPDAIRRRIDRILAADPNDPHAALFLGDLAESRGELDAAATHYRDALARDPALPYGWFALGVVLDRQGRPQQALSAMTEAVRLAPDHQTYLTNLAHAQQRAGDVDGALAQYRRVLRLDDAFILGHVDLARALRAMGQQDAAAQAFQRAAELLDDPAVSRLPKNRLPWYLLAGWNGTGSLDLRSLAQKRCYVRLTVAMMRRGSARGDDEPGCELPASEETALREWVAGEHRSGRPGGR